MVGHTAQYPPPYWQHCNDNSVYSGLWNFPKVQKFCDHFWYSTCCIRPSKGAYLKDMLFLCEGNGVSVVSYPANEQVSSSIPSSIPWSIYLLWNLLVSYISIWVNIFHQLHLDGGKHFWDYLFSKILAWWNSIQQANITQKSRKPVSSTVEKGWQSIPTISAMQHVTFFCYGWA